MRFDDLSYRDQCLLVAWFALARAVPPEKSERMPVGLSGALSHLSRRVADHPKGLFSGYHRTGGIVHGRRHVPMARPQVWRAAT